MKYSEIEQIVKHYKHGNMAKICIFANLYIAEWQSELESSKTKGTISGKLNEEMYLLGESVEFEEKYFSLFANYMSTTERQDHLRFYAKNVRKLYNMPYDTQVLKDAKNMLLKSMKEVNYSRSELGLIVKRLKSYKKELMEDWNINEKVLLASKGFVVKNTKNNDKELIK